MEHEEHEDSELAQHILGKVVRLLQRRPSITMNGVSATASRRGARDEDQQLILVTGNPLLVLM